MYSVKGEDNIPGKGEITLTKSKNMNSVFKANKENQFIISIKSSNLRLWELNSNDIKITFL